MSRVRQFDFRKMSFYQIWVRSFCDGNGDGIGDLYGVYDRLDYIKSLGVDGIWFSPIFPSPNADFGYDISDYRNIHEDFGTLDQFRKVLDKAHALGLKVLLDLVINHTSDEHPWFKESCKGRDNPYSDYYIWRDPRFIERKERAGKKGETEEKGKAERKGETEEKEKAGKKGETEEKGRGEKKGQTEKKERAAHRPPNNWYSQFEGLAWEYCPSRQQYYLHVFARRQPDLNMDNPKVREEVKGIMRFWLDMGVDGFREDVITYISKDMRLPDGIPFLPAINGLPFYNEGPNLRAYLKEFRKVALSYGAIQVGEAPFTGVKGARRLSAGRNRVLDMVIQFETMTADCFLTEYIHHPFSLWKLKRAFSKWQKGLGRGAWNALYLENHDHPRVIDRYGSLQFWRESGTMLAGCYIFQRGTPFIYQGQELGMTNIALPDIGLYRDVASINAYHSFHRNEPKEKRLHRIHISSRDSARTPVQWSPGANAGFSEHEPWFHINPNYTRVNAETEEADPGSILNFYRKCLHIRKSCEALLKGGYREYAWWRRHLYVYEREYHGERVLVICSFSKHEECFWLPYAYRDGKADILIDNYDEAKRLVSRGRTARLRPYEIRVLKIRVL